MCRRYMLLPGGSGGSGRRCAQPQPGLQGCQSLSSSLSCSICRMGYHSCCPTLEQVSRGTQGPSSCLEHLPLSPMEVSDPDTKCCWYLALFAPIKVIPACMIVHQQKTLPDVPPVSVPSSLPIQDLSNPSPTCAACRGPMPASGPPPIPADSAGGTAGDRLCPEGRGGVQQPAGGLGCCPGRSRPVDVISLGVLTQAAPPLDFSLKLFAEGTAPGPHARWS